MKHIFKIALSIVIAMIACGWTMTAQTSNNQRISREQLAERQARHIAEEMALDKAVADRLVDTYCRCQKEIWALGPRVGRDSLRNAGAADDSQTAQNIQARFDRSQKILDIRKKYYAEYSKFLTQKQINRVYELERQMMLRLTRQKNGGGK